MEVLNFNALINEEEENLFDYIKCKVLFKRSGTKGIP